jgi:REP element-mobilizing transposase RayT
MLWFMSRPLRIELASGLYHVTSRGDRREAIYRDDQDRTDWLTVLGEVCRRFNWRCHAYCEMTNHYHFVVETPDGNLSKGMRQLNGVYTQTTNRRHGLVGHLFQGRFKAILVEREAYLLELARYVVLNPVRAAMVPEEGDWPWSSYRAMVGQAPAPAWLETDWVLGQFGEGRSRAQGGYAAFVRQGGSGSRACGKGCAIRSFSAVRRSCSATALPPSPWNGCAKFRAPSAGRSPSPSPTSLYATPSGARQWRGLSKPAFTRCRRSPTISAFTTPP